MPVIMRNFRAVSSKHHMFGYDIDCDNHPSTGDEFNHSKRNGVHYPMTASGFRPKYL